MCSTWSPTSRQNGARSALIAALHYQKHAIHTRAAIFQTVSEGVFSEVGGVVAICVKGPLSQSILSTILRTPASLKPPHETPFHCTLNGVFVHVNPFEDIPLEAPEECGHISVSPQLSASRLEMSLHVTLSLGALVDELVHRYVEATPSLQDFYIRHSLPTLRFPRIRLSS
jgi:hypothetical protein